MNAFTELADTMTSIAEDACGDFNAIPIGDLLVAARALVFTNTAATGVLVNQCGSDQERARVEVSRALELPPRVLARRASEAKAIIEEGSMPSVFQVAAWCAVMLREVERISARVKFLRSGSQLH